MAAMKGREGALEKGSKLLVTVEEALSNVIMVVLMRGTKTYRGVLMESNVREGPHGINFSREQVETANQPLKPPEVLYVDPNHEGSKPTISSLPLRHTYLLDPDAVDPKLLPPPPKKDIIKPIREKKIVRAMRLRPRKVLCSNCKKGLHDSDQPSKDGNSKKEKDEGGGVNSSQGVSSKRKTDLESSPPPSKKSRRVETTEPAKTVPILKISFATPRGGGKVLKIPVKGCLPLGSEDRENISAKDSDMTALTHQQYRKMRKALKKAKLKEKSKATDTLVGDGENGDRVYHKKSKHGKHKMKRKHKHRDLEDRSKLDKHKELISDAKDDVLTDKNGVENESSNNSSLNEGHIDSLPRVSISNADEFTIKKSVVRLTKLNLKDKNQQYGLDANPENSDLPVSHDDNDSNSSADSLEGTSKAGDDPECENDSTPTPTPYQVEVSDISDPEDNPVEVNTNQSQFTSPPLYNPDPTQISPIPPLMMRIQTRNVSHCELPDGRILNCSDIIWGKVHGFPWWPGQIITITESFKDNGVVIAQMAHISWFGSSTMSYMECQELYPFLQYYKSRYNKRKKGPYKMAIKQATIAAQSLVKDGSLDVCKSPLSESDDDNSLVDNNSESNFDGLHDMDDIQSLQSLDKENLNSVDNLSHHEFGKEPDFHDDLKKVEEESIRKSETMTEDIQQLNQELENYSLQINQDIALEMMED